MLIAIDHGNKQIKLASGKTFNSGISDGDAFQPIDNDFILYEGKYYTITEKRIPYMRDKTTDDRFYMLTLFAIGYEIEQTGSYVPDLIRIKLAAGLPPAHFGPQHKQFEQYLRRGVIEEFEFHGKLHRVFISEATAYPQAFAAAMPVYRDIRDLPKVVVIDIGGFTADYLLIRFGQPDLSVCDSLENGVIFLYNQIIKRVNSELGSLLAEADIDAIINGRVEGYKERAVRIVNDSARGFVSDLFGSLRERSVDLSTGTTVFVGGGSMLFKTLIEESGKAASPMFVGEISANAKGYELMHRETKAGG